MAKLCPGFIQPVTAGDLLHSGHPPGAPQPYLESKWGESQSKAEVLLGSSGTWPENSLRLARVGGQGTKCKLFLSDSVSRKAGHRQNLKKQDHFPLVAGEQQLSQSNKQLNDVR